jgi:hypothetical protein
MQITGADAEPVIKSGRAAVREFTQPPPPVPFEAAVIRPWASTVRLTFV